MFLFFRATTKLMRSFERGLSPRWSFAFFPRARNEKALKRGIPSAGNGNHSAFIIFSRGGSCSRRYISARTSVLSVPRARYRIIKLFLFSSAIRSFLVLCSLFSSIFNSPSEIFNYFLLFVLSSPTTDLVKGSFSSETFLIMNFISALHTTTSLMLRFEEALVTRSRTFETEVLLLRSTPRRYTCNDKLLAADDAELRAWCARGQIRAPNKL